MKILHIPAKSEINIKKIVENLDLTGKIGLISTIQYVHQLKELSQKIPNSIVCGQILGCNATKAKNKEIEKYLYIGTGKFHPIEIKRTTNKEVYIANPYTGKIIKLEDKEIEKIKKQEKIAYISYLKSNKIGLLVSTKSGQNNLAEAKEFKKKSEKKCYIFLFDTLNPESLEDFNDIECWINTACPRIAIDDYSKFNKPIINLEKIKEFIEE